jgi:hypothetical protein
MTRWNARGRLLGAAALAVVATAAGGSPARADSGSPASPNARLLRLAQPTINPVVSLGETMTDTVTVANVSDDSVRISTVEVFGDNLGVEETFAGGCFGTMLAPGGTCSYTMTFTPVAAERVSGTFCVTGIRADLAVADRECGRIHGVAH